MKKQTYQLIEKVAFVVFHAARHVILWTTDRQEALNRQNTIERFVVKMQREARILGARP